MTETMTKDMALSYLRRAVEEKGEDFVYKEHFDETMGCKYSVAGQPACIVGWVLYYHTGKVPFTAPSEDEYQVCTIRDLASGGGVINFPIHDNAVELLRSVQRNQDMGIPWGQALEIAESGVMNA